MNRYISAASVAVPSVENNGVDYRPPCLCLAACEIPILIGISKNKVPLLAGSDGKGYGVEEYTRVIRVCGSQQMRLTRT